MEDFASILVRDYGLKPQGKSAPMSSKVSPVVGGSSSSGSNSNNSRSSRGIVGDERKSMSGRISGNSTFQDDLPYLSRKNGSSKNPTRSSYGGGDDIFTPGNYDDVFGGPPKSSASGPRYDNDVFGEPQPSETVRAPVFDDLLFGGLGVSDSKVKLSSPSGVSPRRPDLSHFSSNPAESVFDELLPGFSAEPAAPAVKSKASGDTKVAVDADPFVPLMADPLVVGSGSSTSTGNAFSSPFLDPLDVFSVSAVPPNGSSTSEGPARASSNAAAGGFDALDIFDSFPGQTVTMNSSLPRGASQTGMENSRKSAEGVSLTDIMGSREQSPTEEIETIEKDFPESSTLPDKSSSFFFYDSNDSSAPAASGSSAKAVGDESLFSSSLDSPIGRSFRSRSFEGQERWLTVDKVKLVTKPSAVPPPSRPPPLPGSSAKHRSASRPKLDYIEAQDDSFVSTSWPSTNSFSAPYSNSSEEEQTGGSGTPGGSRNDFFGRMDSMKGNTGKDAGDVEKIVDMDSSSAPKAREERQEKEESARMSRDSREREMKEVEAREERERERQRRYKEKEREREKDRAAVQRVTMEARDRAAVESRERAQRTADELREKAQRSAVERATTEARERAAERATADAREKAAALARARADRERAAVEKANAEARDRAEQRAAAERAAAEKAGQRAAVERVAAEARERAEKAAVERAAADARERAEKAAVERAAAEARERAAERAAVERASAEARERAAERAAAADRAQSEARERAADRVAADRAAAEARERAAERARNQMLQQQQQRKSENDLESFFGASAPNDQRQRPASTNNMHSNHNDFGSSDLQRKSSVSTSRTSTAVNDEWASLFGVPTANSNSDDVREIEGESIARRQARNGSHQRSRERAAKALAEIKQRDLDIQREQAEKHRAADQLDSEIKRWAAGKEGNLRALLSTLQYVLWPECGWQPVSLSDLITAAAVKKIYRKATLFVHPDKVQQKGATVQQKYIAEKVFDLLKEAWNKFNSEELF